MIFVFDSDAASLHVHDAVREVLHACLAEDLKRQRWLFFAEDGSPLRADCHADGTRLLRPWASCSSCRLEQLLPWIVSVSGPAGLDSRAALKAHLGA